MGATTPRRHLAPPVVVVTGLKQEADLITGSATPGRGLLALVGAGDAIGLERAVRAAAPGTSGLISFGLAGGLAPGLRPGDLILGREVIADGLSWATDAAWTDLLLAALPDALPGPVAAGTAIINSVDGKSALYARTGAAVVDTESQIVARVAHEHGLPFAVIRAVCDPCDMALPPAALLPLTADGRPNLPGILRSLLRQPRQLPQLIRLGAHSKAAFSTLGMAAGHIVQPGSA